MTTGKIYAMDFKSGAMIALASPGLPVGQVVIESNRYGSKEYVVTLPEVRELSCTSQQTVVCLEDGHKSAVSMARGELCAGWRLGERVLNADELQTAQASAEANRRRIEAERAAAAEAEAQARTAQRAQWAKDFSFLQTPGDKLSPHACGAKNIKKELARAFPGVKFTVKSDSYSGGSSIDVSWDLGPTTREVELITGKYQQGHFNGMEDIYEHSRSQWPEIYGGAKYVSESRGDGDADEVILPLLAARYGCEAPADGKSWHNVVLPGGNGGVNYLSSAARSLIFEQSYPPGAVITGIDDAPEKYGRKSRCIFTLPDGTNATAGTPAARVARLRAKYAEANGEGVRATVESIAAQTGLNVLDVFERLQSWFDEQWEAMQTRGTLEAFAALPEWQNVSPAAQPPKKDSADEKPAPVLNAEKSEAPRVVFNAEKNGVEIHFPGKPGAEVLNSLKSNGWRWSRFSACWYAKRTTENLAFANMLTGVTPADPTEPAASDEEAKALGFENSEQCKAHGEWLENNGSPEFKAWKKTIGEDEPEKALPPLARNGEPQTPSPVLIL